MKRQQTGLLEFILKFPTLKNQFQRILSIKRTLKKNSKEILYNLKIIFIELFKLFFTKQNFWEDLNLGKH